MRGRRQLFAVLAVIAAMVVPALAPASEEAPPTAVEADPPALTPSNVGPEAALAVTVDGTTVTLDASGSNDPDGTIAEYRWDLDGDSAHETTSGTQPRMEREYPAGTTLIASVRVVDDAGAGDDAAAAIAVPVAADEAPAAVEVPEERLVTTEDLAGEADAPAADPAPEPKQPKRVRATRERERDQEDESSARAAASKSVAITDFDFTPSTVNINVGDTVTWTNRGPTDHTATARDRSFDSGNLKRGQTYSKRFDSAGTYAYICTPHPFMTGRVVVGGSGGAGGSGRGSGGGGSGGGTGGASDDAGATGAAGSGSNGDGGSSSGGGGLASTGIDLVPIAVFGFALLAFGAALRLRLTVE